MTQSVFLEHPHRLPHFAPCCIDGLVCVDAILHSEHEDGPGVGRQGRKRPGSDHVPLSWGPQPAVGVQKRNDSQQVERVSKTQVQHKYNTSTAQVQHKYITNTTQFR